MLNYNTGAAKGYYESLSASQWTSLGNDVLSGTLLSALQSRFNISGNYATSLGDVPETEQVVFADGCYSCASAKTLGRTIDFTGVSISDSSVSNTDFHVHMVLHVNVIIVYTGGLPAFGLSFYHTQNITPNA